MDYTPSAELLKEVRAKLVARGSSLAAYCREEGLTRQNISAALAGKRSGPKARTLVAKVFSDIEGGR